MECEFPNQNASDEEIRDLLQNATSIAVVGISPKPERDSHRVAAYLLEQGYEVYAVRPGCKEILGQSCHRELRDIGHPVDIVDIFRRPDAIPEVVEQAIEIGAKAVWMQLGLANNAAADKARAAGLQVVMNKCTKIEHLRLKREEQA